MVDVERERSNVGCTASGTSKSCRREDGIVPRIAVGRR
jgi:hypothetical protein